MLPKIISLRLIVVCIAAASVGLSMALISIAKLMLLVCVLSTVLFAKRRAPEVNRHLAALYTPKVILLALGAFVLSLLWTSAPPGDALGSIGKYGKLLVIAALPLLVRDRREAAWALGSFVAAQLLLLFSSWALFVHLPVPWATSRMSLTEYAVFSSYLDEGIMSAVMAAICWHLRDLAPGRHGKTLATLFVPLFLLNVFYVFSGRSGHVVAIALLSIAIMWELPKKYRPAIVVLPFLLVLVVSFSSPKVRQRLTMVTTEVREYSNQVQSTTSSGIRLGLWRRAVQIISVHPLAGAGVGSWSTEYNQLERQQYPGHKDIEGNGNPHQEYLQWTLQLGFAGLLLFAAFLLAVMRDSWALEKPYARATQSTLVALAVACLFNSTLYDAYIGDFFCVTLGLLLAAGIAQKTATGHPSASHTGKA